MRLICWCSGIVLSVLVKFRNVQCRPARVFICWCSGIAYSGCEAFRYGQYRHERTSICWCSWIAFSKLRHVQIWAVRSCYRFNLMMLRNRVFRLWIVQILVLQSCKGVDWLLFRNRDFRVRNIEICAELYSKKVDLLMSGISYTGCETFWNMQSSPARGLICCCSGIAYSTVRYVQCRRESTSIWRCPGIAFSSLETFIYG